MIRKKTVLGLDIGCRNIRGVELIKDKTIILKNFFFQDLAQRNNRFPEDNNPVEDLGICVNIRKLNNAKVAFGLGIHYTKSIIIMDLPKIPAKELNTAIGFELENKYAINLKEVTYDYYIIDKNLSGTPDTQNIKLFIAENSVIEQTLELIKKISLIPHSIDSEFLAISTSIVFNDYITDENKSYIFIDIGESQISVGLQIGYQLIDVKTSLMALNYISKTLKDNHGLLYAEAEKYKNKLNDSINANANANSNSNTKFDTNVDPNIIASTQEAFVTIVNEIQNFIEEYRIYFERWPLESIFFLGGGCDLFDCCQFFKEKFAVNAIVPNPFKNINIHQNNTFTQADIIVQKPYLFHVAVGLALRELLSK